MRYAFPPATPVSLPVAGTDAAFPVRRVYCVGQDYALHAKEIGGDGRQPPFFFSKLADVRSFPAAVGSPSRRRRRTCSTRSNWSSRCPKAAPTSPLKARWRTSGYAVGIDPTRRDLQAAAKEKGRPWDMAKGFDQKAARSVRSFRRRQAATRRTAASGCRSMTPWNRMAISRR